MSDQNDIPFNPPEPEEQNFKPWEQRAAPGMGGGGGQHGSSPEPKAPDRLAQEMDDNDMRQTINQQSRLAHLPMVNHFTTPDTDLTQVVHSNEEAWRLFVQEQLYDTRRVRLEHFHLFEWFPLTPGRFHTEEARENRQMAYAMMERTPQGHAYFNPYGKASMLRGGIGAVRLRPRLIAGEPHFFMTASSNGVCHEGFPVLIPRRFYGQVKPRLLQEGAVPVDLSGEMRYLLEDLPSFFTGHREIPQLYLHVDELQALPSPRTEVSAYAVSVAISFVGEFRGNEGLYATYATFDSSSNESLAHATNWLGQFYVTERYKGVVVTDFDEVQPHFPDAVFGLPDLMAGKLNSAGVQEFLKAHGMDKNVNDRFFLVYKEINTQGGAYIAGDVNTGGGDFIGRDKNVPPK